MEEYIVEILSSHRREVLIVLLFLIVVIWLINKLTSKEDKWVSKEKLDVYKRQGSVDGKCDYMHQRNIWTFERSK